MTKEERKLWYEFFKLLPVTVKRQEVIGNYIVDFYVPSARLVIELDGSQHFEEKGLARDYERDMALAERGILVRRYANSEVKSNFAGVGEDILETIKQRTIETETENHHG